MNKLAMTTFCMAVLAIRAMEHPDADLELALALSISEADARTLEHENADRELASRLQVEEHAKIPQAIKRHEQVRDLDLSRDKQVIKQILEKNYDVLIGGAGSGYTIDDHIKEIVKHKNRILLIGGVFAGFISWGRKSGLVYIVYLYPEFRGKGHADKLLTEAKRDLKRRGAKKIKAEVFKNNPTAKRFFEQRGFHETGNTRYSHLWTLSKTIS